ncbi:MAG: hypothetical protein IPN53_04305, partial [Comamonadaceae bacterium]|nr:hypothetical protein [Comamonadaceae bacterium]
MTISRNAFNEIDRIKDLMLAFGSRGEGAAFEVLYRRHEGSLFRSVRRQRPALGARTDEVFQDNSSEDHCGKSPFSPKPTGTENLGLCHCSQHQPDQLGKAGKVAQSTAESGDDNSPLDWLAQRVSGRSPSSEDSAYWRAASSRSAASTNYPMPSVASFLMHRRRRLQSEENGSHLADCAGGCQEPAA